MSGQRPNLPRHEGLPALLSHATDPAPRKTRKIEWIGERSPLDEPVVAWRLMTKQFTALQEAVIRRAAAMARTRVKRERLFEHDHQHAQAVLKGLHRTYLFTKANNYIQDVDYHDVDILLGSESGHEFRDLDAPDPPTPTVTPNEVRLIEREMARDHVMTGSPATRIIVAKT